MLKMVDVLGQDVVQSFSQAAFTQSEQVTHLLNEGILKASDHDLKSAIAALFQQLDSQNLAAVLDISAQRMAEIEAGAALKDDAYLADTFKIVALGLALETQSIDALEVSDCLVDYPM